MSKHKYSTYVLLIIFGIVITYGAVALLESEDIDEVCNSDNNTMKRVNGSWICSETNFAEGYYHSYSTPITLIITNTNQYYKITNYTVGETVGIVGDGNGTATINKTALYKISMGVAMSGGNNGDYELELHKNNVAEPKCATFQTTTAGDLYNVQVNCLIRLNQSDEIDMRVKDIGNPSQDITYNQLNINIMEVT